MTADLLMNPRDLWDGARQRFREAARSAGHLQRDIRIAGAPIHLEFAGPRMLPILLPALGHVQAGEDPSALKLMVWDRAGTGVDFPRAPWSGDSIIRRGQIEGWNHADIQLAIEAGFGGVSLCDRLNHEAIFFAPDAGTIPYYESASPLRAIFSWALAANGLQLIHAGAVGRNGAGVLLVGKGGSGKSTSCLLCLEAGFQYVSDDYSVLGATPAPRVHTIYNSAKVRAEDADKFSALFRERPPETQEKAHVFIRDRLPAQLVDSLHLKAIVMPRVVGAGETRLTPGSAVEALRSLAPSTIFQLPGAGKQAFDFLGGIVRVLPSYHLELGGRRSDVPRVIGELLA